MPHACIWFWSLCGCSVVSVAAPFLALLVGRIISLPSAFSPGPIGRGCALASTGGIPFPNPSLPYMAPPFRLDFMNFNDRVAQAEGHSSTLDPEGLVVYEDIAGNGMTVWLLNHFSYGALLCLCDRIKEGLELQHAPCDVNDGQGWACKKFPPSAGKVTFGYALLDSSTNRRHKGKRFYMTGKGARPNAGWVHWVITQMGHPQCYREKVGHGHVGRPARAH